MSGGPTGKPVLAGVRVLVTRPQPQAGRLAQCLRRAGADVIELPLLQIEPLAETEEARRPLLDLDLFDQVIVTSVPAASIGLEWIENCWPQLPLGLQWWAIGDATASQLARFSVVASIPKTGATSEDLLALRALQAVGEQRILLLSGSGGRDLIETTLQQRGAEVVKLPLYQRVCPQYEQNQLREMLQAAPCDWIVVSSGQVLHNLLKYLTPSENIAPLLVPSARVQEQALAAGFDVVRVSEGASDRAVLDALQRG